MPQVPGADRVSEVERRCADQQIRKGNRAAGLPGFRIHLCRKLSHGRSKRLHRDGSENGVQVLTTLAQSARASARDAGRAPVQ